tara:strand:+ start:73416 stop:74753 length:1338 start_codon:yes stop_codon:yes gene_type:complete
MLEIIKTTLSLYFFIPIVTIVGFYFSVRFKFLQLTHIPRAWNLFTSDRKLEGDASSFSAMSAVLGGNLGTGNIAGIAVALSMGGPGAIFWMWIMAILGSILRFIGCTLGVLYRRKDEAGENVGGPMYYLYKALKLKKTAQLFSVVTILTAFTVGNLVQMNSIALPLVEAGIPPGLIGVVMAILVGGVILGGLHRFSAVVSRVVPVMAVFYLLACLIIVALNLSKILPALHLIVTSAFQPLPMASGVIGYTVLQGIASGFDRGLFATDCGVGLAPMIHASVESHTPRINTALTQGLISTLSPFIVMIVCTLTGLVLIMTDTWNIQGLESTNVCIEAFKRGFHFDGAGHIVTITLFFFAFTTILTWSFCAGKAIEFLSSTKLVKPLQLLFILLIPVGAFLKVNLIWTVADLLMNLMLLINVIGLVLLAKHVIRLTNQPVWKKVLAEK